MFRLEGSDALPDFGCERSRHRIIINNDRCWYKWLALSVARNVVSIFLFHNVGFFWAQQRPALLFFLLLLLIIFSRQLQA